MPSTAVKSPNRFTTPSIRTATPSDSGARIPMVSLAASATPPPRRAGPGSLDEPILTADEGRGKEASYPCYVLAGTRPVGRPAHRSPTTRGPSYTSAV